MSGSNGAWPISALVRISPCGCIPFEMISRNTFIMYRLFKGLLTLWTRRRGFVYLKRPSQEIRILCRTFRGSGGLFSDCGDLSVLPNNLLKSSHSPERHFCLMKGAFAHERCAMPSPVLGQCKICIHTLLKVCECARCKFLKSLLCTLMVFMVYRRTIISEWRLKLNIWLNSDSSGTDNSL